MRRNAKPVVMHNEHPTIKTDKRDQFTTGASRNSSAGKGAYADICPLMLKRLALLLERGAKDHGHLNYAKGMPLMRTMESLKRHADQYLEGERGPGFEDHMAAVIFNAMCIINTEVQIQRGLLPKELDDLPNYLSKPDESR